MERLKTSAAGSGSTGRRRLVTVLFSDLCSSTSLADSIDPEELADVLRLLKETAGRVVQAHSGVANQFYGDGVLAVFGLHNPREDDARRAIEAALELHEAVRGLKFGERMPGGAVPCLHSGIHGGIVFTDRGDETQGRYELVGDTVHIAARLCAAAERDEILVSERCLRGVRAFFDSEDVGRVALKGIAEPVHVYRVRTRTDVSTRFEGRERDGLTPFVGRDAETRALLRAVERAADGDVKVVGIVGSAGIGKTRLLRKLQRESSAAGASVYYGYCESYGTTGPLQPFVQILGQIFEVEGAASPQAQARAVGTWVEKHHPQLLGRLPVFQRLLSLPVASDAPGNGDEQAAVQGVSELLAGLAAKQRVVLIIDDWQWVDDASRRALDRTLRKVRDLPLVVITGSRGNDLNDPVMSPAPTIELAPLGNADAARMVQSLLETAPEVGTTERILLRSGGNPLFLEELCSSISEWAPTDHSASTEAEVPPSLHALIEARVERLPEREAHLLAVSAVIGNVVPIALLEAAGVELADESLRVLAEADLLYEGEVAGTLRFKHGITRDVVYQRVGLRRRRELHRAIAKALEAPISVDRPEALAYHYAAAGDHVNAAHHGERAGDNALASSSLYQAVHHYRATMTALEKLSQTDDLRRRWVSVCLRWATACAYTPASEQIGVLERALAYCRDLGDRQALAETYFRIGYITYALGAPEDAKAHFDKGLIIAQELDDRRLVAQMQLGLGVSYGAMGEYRTAIEHVDLGIGTKQRLFAKNEPPPMSVGSAYAIGCKGFVLADQGDFSASRECFRLALDSVRDSGHVVEGSILGLFVLTLLWQGCWHEASDTAARTRAVARRTNAPYVYAMAEINGAYAEFRIDPTADVVERLQRNADWLDARDIRLFQSYSAYATVAEARLASGDLEGAREYAERALGRAAHRDRIGEAMAYRVLAGCAERGVDAGDDPEALFGKALAAARSRGSRWDEAVTLLALAERQARVGRTEQARELVTRVRAEFEQRAMHWYGGRAEELARQLSAS